MPHVSCNFFCTILNLICEVDICVVKLASDSRKSHSVEVSPLKMF